MHMLVKVFKISSKKIISFIAYVSANYSKVTFLDAIIFQRVLEPNITNYAPLLPWVAILTAEISLIGVKVFYSFCFHIRESEMYYVLLKHVCFANNGQKATNIM